MLVLCSEELLKRYTDLGGELHMVDLDRMTSTAGLGLCLSGNRNPNVMSVFVVSIPPDGVAAGDGRVRIGDELVEVSVPGSDRL